MITLTPMYFALTAVAIILLCAFLGFAYNKWVASGDNSSQMKYIGMGAGAGAVISAIVWFMTREKKEPEKPARGVELAEVSEPVIGVDDYIRSMKAQTIIQ